MSETRLMPLMWGCWKEWLAKRRQIRDAAKRAGELDPATYWQKPDGIERNRNLWIDPDENVRGLLAADWIEYLALNGRMIFPFDRQRLKPSSYELTLGPIYQQDGREQVLTERDPHLIIPSNSIVFVAMQEALVMPHYVAARFDLAIEYIYQGLLLGTGPQVDPGFQGVLSCPLHNISNNEIKLTLGRPFAKIDFEKTSWHESLTDEAKTWLEAVESEDDLYDNVEQIVGKDGKPQVLFRCNKRWRWPIVDYPSGQMTVISSVNAIDRKVDAAHRRLNRFTLGGVVAILALLVASVPIGLQLYEISKDTIDDASGQLRESERALEDLEREYVVLTATQAAMESRLATLEAVARGTPAAAQEVLATSEDPSLRQAEAVPR